MSMIPGQTDIFSLLDGGARHDDAQTSHDAAQSHAAKLRWGSHRQRLLEAYSANVAGLTDVEACEVADLPGGWKRCSELRRMGLIEWDGTRRTSSSGADGNVSVITTDGRQALMHSFQERPGLDG